MSRIDDYNKGIKDERKRKEGDSSTTLWLSAIVLIIGIAYYSRNDWQWFMDLLMRWGY